MARNTSYDPRHEWHWIDDFNGGGIFGTSATENDPWVMTVTSTTGTPTHVRTDLGESTVAGAFGTATISMDTAAEVQNVCMSFGNKLAFDIDKISGFEARVKMSQATADAATQFACGLTGDRNDTIDTIANAALFRVVGADSTTALVVESDDGTNNNDDVATGTTLVNGWKVLRIDLTDLSSIKFYVDDAQVGSATTFDVSNYDAGLQPFFQIQKSADANADGFAVDYVRLWGRR